MVKYSDKNTSCKECIFATWGSYSYWDGITQTGCSKGMIEAFRSYKNNVLEAYDKEKEFYVIEDRRCKYYRTQHWKEYAEDRVEEMIKLETTLPFHFILFVDDSFVDFKYTVKDIRKQTQKPIHLTIVRQKTSKATLKDINLYMMDKKPEFAWSVENLLEPLVDKKETSRMTKDDVVHLVQKKIPSEYYIVGDTNRGLPKKLIAKINTAIVDKAVQFAMIDDYIMVVPKPVHQYWFYHGDYKISIPDKIRDYQCQNQDKKVIWTLDQITSQNPSQFL